MFSDSELRGIRVPTLVMIGDREVIYNPHKVAAKAKRLIPDVSVEIVPGAGHALFYDRPDIVNRRVIEFAGKGGN
jgi:pimeloyl-ACP methyl ester carboxylesterase